MKLLYIDAYLKYINPTSELLGAMLTAATRDIRCYGPGYSTDAELAEGILHFMERTGPYDGVFFGANVPFFAWDEIRRTRSIQHIRRFGAFGSSPQKLAPFFEDVLQNARRLPVRHRFLSLLNFDYYAANTRHTDILEALEAFIVGPGAQFAVVPEELPDWAFNERHYARKRHLISNVWSTFLSRWSAHVISLPHFVADSEFCFRGLADRGQRAAVPGVEYFMRKEGLKALTRRGIRPASKKIFKLIRYADRLGLRAFSRYVPLRLYQTAYQGTLADTRFVYTSRDGFGIPVRKFFEIPAAGALMLCIPPHGFSEFGFHDGEHYVEVPVDVLPDMIEKLEREPERAQAIASSGRKLVFDRHSLRARAEQFAQCLAAIAEGGFAGSAWRAGEFEVLGPQPQHGAVPKQARVLQG